MLGAVLSLSFARFYSWRWQPLHRRSCGLLAVDPGVAETLGMASLGPMGIYIVENMGKAGNGKELFVTSRCVPGSQGIRARVQLGWREFGCHWFDSIAIKLQLLKAKSGDLESGFHWEILVYIRSWLQIQRSGFDSRRCQIFWEVVGLQRDPLSLVSTIEELLEWKSGGSGL
jgi:hypothetical protein